MEFGSKTNQLEIGSKDSDQIWDLRKFRDIKYIKSMIRIIQLISLRSKRK
jgi:hypothetical protein